MLASLNELESIPSSSVFGKNFYIIGTIPSLDVWWHSPAKPSGPGAFSSEGFWLYVKICWWVYIVCAGQALCFFSWVSFDPVHWYKLFTYSFFCLCVFFPWSLFRSVWIEVLFIFSENHLMVSLIFFSLVFFYFLSLIPTSNFPLLTWVSFSLLSLVSCGSWDQWLETFLLSLLWVFSAINPLKQQHPTDAGMLCFHFCSSQNPSSFPFHFFLFPWVAFFFRNVLLSL